MKPRGELVDVKGKGKLQTSWLQVSSNTGSTASSSAATSRDLQWDSAGKVDEQIAHTERLVKWNVEELKKLLTQVVARRKVKCKKSNHPQSLVDVKLASIPLENVVEVISFPQFDASDYKSKETNLEEVELNDKVVAQLTDYVSCIGAMYLDNPFHNFEHASVS